LILDCDSGKIIKADPSGNGLSDFSHHKSYHIVPFAGITHIRFNGYDLRRFRHPEGIISYAISNSSHKGSQAAEKGFHSSMFTIDSYITAVESISR
jgi:hypothetical protein